MSILLSNFGFTRDDAIWFWGKLVGFSGLVTTGVFDLKSLGLPEKYAHFLMVACAAIWALSAQMSTSKLPGK